MILENWSGRRCLECCVSNVVACWSAFCIHVIHVIISS